MKQISSAMNHKSTVSILAFLIVMISQTSATLVAETKKHVHGVVNTEVVFAKGSLLIHFESPAANIIGFEHRPRNESQKKSIADASSKLRKIETWLAFGLEDKCSLSKIKLEEPFSEDHKDSHDDEYSHDDEHSHDDDEEETHSEFSAEYQFQCEKGASLQTLDFRNLFENYKGVQEVEVSWINGNKQSAAKATRSNQVLKINN